MDEFHSYTSIENTHNAKFMNQVYNHCPPDEQWCATEKIHGSNFSAHVDGNTIKWGKRTAFLTDEELPSFYNCHHVKENYGKKIMSLFQSIQSKSEEKIEVMRVFGELCGGGYEGILSGHKYTVESMDHIPKIKIINSYKNKVKMVQQEVQYVPTIEFIIFDICIITSKTRYYMGMKDVIHECNMADLPCVPILHIGTIVDLVKLSPNFITTIPQIFDLPAFENNMAEGYEFKPLNEKKLPLGSRSILKHKSATFGEKSNKKVIVSRSIIKATEKHNEIIDHICQFICVNRLNNVKSKLTSDELTNNKKVSGHLIQDAIADALKELSEEDIKFYSKERSIIMPQLNTFAIETLHKSTMSVTTVV